MHASGVHEPAKILTRCSGHAPKATTCRGEGTGEGDIQVLLPRGAGVGAPPLVAGGPRWERAVWAFETLHEDGSPVLLMHRAQGTARRSRCCLARADAARPSLRP